MGIIETIIIGASMSMDAFAISVCSGLKMQRVNYAKAALIAFFFGGFQALMPALGWIFGSLFASYVDRWDHYIAFVVLAYLGAKMIIDVFKSSGDSEDASALDLRSIFMVAFATSVDTLAVGVTFGMDPTINILSAAPIIGVTTFAICIVGVLTGNIFGARRQKQAQFIGGAMLILIGAKILLEGLGIIDLPI